MQIPAAATAPAPDRAQEPAIGAIPRVTSPRPAPRHPPPWPAGLTIRRCEPTDGQALFDLFNSEGCQRDAIPEPYVSASHVSEWIRLCRAHSYLLAAVGGGAVDGGAVAGYGGLFLYAGARSHVGSLSLAVQDAWQGRGIGKAVLRALLATADHHALLTRVELTVLADNARAIALYERFGFSVEGRHRCFARRGDVDLAGLTMARVLDR